MNYEQRDPFGMYKVKSVNGAASNAKDPGR